MQFKKPLFWDYKELSLWSILLFPLSILYLLIILILRKLKNLKPNKKVPIPIICVGNIYLGGTGKTPLVKEIYNIAKSLDKNPAIIKKYYDYLYDEIKMLENIGKLIQITKER